LLAVGAGIAGAGIYWRRVLPDIFLSGLYELSPLIAQNSGNSNPVNGLVAGIVAGEQLSRGT
jgi:hypothetical protein